MVNTSLENAFTEARTEILVVTLPEVSGDGDSYPIEALLSAPSRDFLYYEESVDMHVLLHLPESVTVQHINSIAKRTVVSLEILASEDSRHIINASSQPMARQDSNSGRDGNMKEQGQVIHTKVLTMNGPSTVITTHNGHPVLIWPHSALIPHPRARPPFSRISINVSFSLSDGSFGSIPDDDYYLDDATNREPSYNLLRALESDLYLSKNAPTLLASRVSSVAPLIESAAKKLRKSTKRVFPCTPAIVTRTRTVQIPNSNHIILSVEMETADSSQRSVAIDSVELDVSSAKVKCIGSSSFPMTLQTTDILAYSFDVDPDRKHHHTTCHATLRIALRPTFIDAEKTIIGPKLLTRHNISMRLRDVPTLRSNTTTNNATTTTSPRRPLPLSRSSSAMLTRPLTRTVSSTGNPIDALSTRSTTPLNGTTPNSSLAGTTVTVSAPPKCRFGEPFDVTIVLGNRSSTPKVYVLEVTRTPYKKALPGIPPATPATIPASGSVAGSSAGTGIVGGVGAGAGVPSSTSSASQQAQIQAQTQTQTRDQTSKAQGRGPQSHNVELNDTDSIPTPPHQQQQSHQQQQQQHQHGYQHIASQATDLLCLTPTTKSPTVQAGATHTSTLSFLPLGPGRIAIHDVRVVDAATGHGYEMRDMPVIVVL